MNALFAESALLPHGWARNVLLEWNAAGVLTELSTAVEPGGQVLRAAGPVLPGMPNLHSHAFQRAMAGLTEYRAPGQNDFWSWRKLMYRFALELQPDDLQAIATQLYIEMLKCGYTSVCEFHYLHHDPHGRPYANRLELAERIVAAAGEAGIGLTLLPVLYEHSGFGKRMPLDEQRRFVTTPDRLLDMLAELHGAHPEHDRLRYGVAPHSLRAVSPESLTRLVDGLNATDARAPIHIHVAEQIDEVADSLAALGTRPVTWLLDRFQLTSRWCLVHATHMSAKECVNAAVSGATVGLCPSTEANLGDGIFDATGYLAAGGAWGIGSDSHVIVNVREELRWLEYAQRLLHRARNVLGNADVPRVAEHLFLEAVSGGAKASGREIAGLAIGQCADLMVLDAADADCSLADPAAALSAWIFGDHGNHGVSDVMVGGRWVVEQGHHAREERALRDYVRVRDALLDR
jgi:formimidoylglutamate deiminase